MKALQRISRREYVLDGTGEVIQSSQLRQIHSFTAYKEDVDAALHEYKGFSLPGLYYAVRPIVRGVSVSIFERTNPAASFSSSLDILEFRNGIYVDAAHELFVPSEKVEFLVTKILERDESLEVVLAEEAKRLFSQGKHPTHYDCPLLGGLVQVLHVMEISSASFSPLQKAAK